MDTPGEIRATQGGVGPVPIKEEADISLLNRLAAERDECIQRSEAERGQAEFHSIEANRYGRMAEALQQAIERLQPDQPTLARDQANIIE